MPDVLFSYRRHPAVRLTRPGPRWQGRSWHLFTRVRPAGYAARAAAKIPSLPPGTAMPRKDPGPLTLADLEHRDFATVPEYAAVMRCDPRTVYAAIRAGDIPATKVGSKSFIP